jgi:hypothetical protein
MHRIRILTTGADGRISISKAELENLLAIAYQDGLEEGKKEAATKTNLDWTYQPYITCNGTAINTATGTGTGTITTTTCAHEDGKCTCDNEKNHDKAIKTNVPAIHATYTVTPEEAQEISKRVSDFFSANSVNDVFTNLKKELGL